MCLATNLSCFFLDFFKNLPKENGRETSRQPLISFSVSRGILNSDKWNGCVACVCAIRGLLLWVFAYKKYGLWFLQSIKGNKLIKRLGSSINRPHPPPDLCSLYTFGWIEVLAHPSSSGKEDFGLFCFFFTAKNNCETHEYSPASSY